MNTTIFVVLLWIMGREYDRVVGEVEVGEWGEGEGEGISVRFEERKDALVRLFASAVATAVVGIGIFMACCRPSHRWTFYKTVESGPENHKKAFLGKPNLMFVCTSVDEQKVFYSLLIHPSYLDKAAVKEWCLGLKADCALFQGVELSDGCDNFAGFSFEAFLIKLKSQFSWYGSKEGGGDVESVQEVERHLDSLAAELEMIVDGRLEVADGISSMASALQVRERGRLLEELEKSGVMASGGASEATSEATSGATSDASERTSGATSEASRGQEGGGYDAAYEEEIRNLRSEWEKERQAWKAEKEGLEKELLDAKAKKKTE
jgi:hypothetical protein